jgi:hypothetical protein
MFIPELKRHSASQLNSFIEYRSSWYLQRIKGIRTNVGVHAFRGTAVEAGINYFIENDDATKESAIKHALSVYSDEAGVQTNDFAIRQSIAPCVIAGIESFEDKGYFLNPPELQSEINIRLPGCKIDLYGKLDYKFADKVVDNKVTSKTPKSLKQGYILQGAVYKKATGLPVVFHFIVPLKTSTKVVEIELSDDDYAYGMELATTAAQHIERIYDSLDGIDGRLLDALFFTNPSSLFNWDEKSLHSEQFNIKIPLKNSESDD